MIDEAQVCSHPDWDDVINLTHKVNEVIRALNTAEAGKQSGEAPAQQANYAIIRSCRTCKYQTGAGGHCPSCGTGYANWTRITA